MHCGNEGWLALCLLLRVLSSDGITDLWGGCEQGISKPGPRPSYIDELGRPRSGQHLLLCCLLEGQTVAAFSERCGLSTMAGEDCCEAACNDAS